jgi:hypothetical protein
VTVPPFFGAAVVDVPVLFAADDVVVVDELPQALSTTTVPAVRSKASIDLECLFTTPPPLAEVGIVPVDNLIHARALVGVIRRTAADS